MLTAQYWQLLASELQYPYSMVWQGASSAHSSGDARAAVRTEIQEDFTSLTVSFDSLNVATIRQSAKYNVNTNTNHCHPILTRSHQDKIIKVRLFLLINH